MDFSRGIRPLYGVFRNGQCLFVALDFQAAVSFAQVNGRIEWGTYIDWY